MLVRKCVFLQITTVLIARVHSFIHSSREFDTCCHAPLLWYAWTTKHPKILAYNCSLGSKNTLV